MYRKYKDVAEFFVIYIGEAHASDGWQVRVNIRENIIVPMPRSYGEKKAVAQTCAVRLGLEIPVLVDDFERSAERRYHAWPDRLYIIGRDGRIAYKGKAGPFGFNTQKAEQRLRSAIRAGNRVGNRLGNSGEETHRMQEL